MRWFPFRADRRVFAYAIAAVAASTTWLWPHLLHVRQVPDRGDPIFSAWRLARFAHQLGTDPRHLFDGNIFHPLPLTLTYSDATVLQGLIAAPLLWLGADPLIAANILFFLAFPLCALAFFHAGWRLTGDPGAALIAAILGAWYPFHGEHYSHLELQWFMFVPLALTATILVLSRPTVRRGLALGAAVGAQWLASMYLGVMLATLLIPVGLVVALLWRCRPTRALAASLGVAALVAGLSATTAIPYVQSRAARGDRSLAALEPGSARPSDYLDAHRRMASYQWRSRVDNRAERELLPGFSPVVLALAGAALAPSAITAGLAAGAAAAFEWSLGVNGFTYPVLYDWLVPFRGMRVPARFSVLFGSCLVLLGAIGAHAIFRRSTGWRRDALAGALAVAVLVDLRLTTPLVDYWPTVPAIYEQVAPGMVLAEFPAGREIDYMFFSTTHWANLAGGYSGFIPADPDLSAAVESFPSDEALTRLRSRGVTHLTYNCAFERSRERCAFALAQLAGSPLLSLVSEAEWSGAPVRLYQLAR